MPETEFVLEYIQHTLINGFSAVILSVIAKIFYTDAELEEAYIP